MRAPTRATVASFVLALALGACAERRAQDAQCAFNDQCAAGLVCAGQTCRAACRSDRDCVGGAVCVATGRVDSPRACAPPTALPLCLYASDCAPSLRCARDGVCRAQCRTDRDCAVRAPWLVGATCGPDSTCTGGPRVAARPLAPLSGALVPPGPVGLEIDVPAGVTSVVVERCARRTCATVLATITVSGPPFVAMTTVTTPGTWFWRVLSQPLDGGAPTASAAWEITTRAGLPPLRPGRLEAARLDMDADGGPDVAVTASGAATASAKVFIFTGRTGDSRQALNMMRLGEFGAALPTNDVGTSPAAGGDVSGDVYDEVFVVANGTRTIYLATVATSPAFSALAGIAATQVAAIGDVDDNGVPDLLTAEPTRDQIQALLFDSRSPTTPRPQVLPLPTGASIVSGVALAGAGDVNGDALPDALVGVPSARGGSGEVDIARGAPGGPAVREVLRGDDLGATEFGARVAGAGDVNGDGLADIAVLGAPPSVPRRLYLVFGNQTVVTVAAAQVVDLPDPGLAGALAAVAGLGDVNHDGYADLAVSVIGTASSPGRVYVYHGSPTGVAAMPTTTLRGSATGLSYAAAISGPGDLDGDGYADLVVGAPLGERVFVYRGGPMGIDEPTVASVVSPVASTGTFGAGLAP